MPNLQLAYGLYETFRTFLTGSKQGMRAIKASRDGRGRPFGFVEFDSHETVATVMDAARKQPVWLAGRRLRIEPARVQFRYRLQVACPVKEVLAVLHADGISDCDIRVLSTGEQQTLLVVKMASERPDLVHEKWPDLDWTVQKMSDSPFNGSVISTRHSGLVHLIIPATPGHVPYIEYPLPPILLRPPSVLLTPERKLTPCEELNFVENGNDISIHGTHPGDIYVGRLNSMQVTTAELAQRFGHYGQVSYTRLYNKQAIGIDGVPIDSHAFIRFAEEHAALNAIAGEDKVTWHGQTIKCEQARPPLLNDGPVDSPWLYHLN